MKRWPLIRHIRWLWLAWQLSRWTAAWRSVGLAPFGPNESDIHYLDAVWKGEA